MKAGVAVLGFGVFLGCSSAIDITPRDPTPERPTEKALGLSASDHEGRPFDLGAAVASKPTVVIFYRGHW